MVPAGLASVAQTGVAGARISGLSGQAIGAAQKPGAQQVDFGGVLHDAIAGVQKLEDEAAATVQGLMRGDGVDVHAAMIATQKADLAFEMALGVRNKAVAAYQQLMNTQF